MKRLLLTFVCCFPLIFSSSLSFSLDLVGPNGEKALSNQEYGPLSKNETLWSVATKLRPNNAVSVQQTLLAIYKLNPDAFVNGNINQPIASSVIAVPSDEFVRDQTNREAMALIKKYSNTSASKTVKITEKAKTNSALNEKTEYVPPKTEKLTQQILKLQNELMLLKTESAKQLVEFNNVEEALLVESENYQKLKQLLPPLKDELSTTQTSLELELDNNKILQGIIDDYKKKLDEVAERPFSGEGAFNAFLRWVTSSLTSLLIVILTPLLLVMIFFVVVSRLSVNRSLEEQNEELAQSTSMLMEESGKFDTLLTDDIFADTTEEVDFTESETVEEPETIDIDETLDDNGTEIESIDLEDIVGSSEDEPVTVDLEIETGTLADTIDLDADENDPFGIEALVSEDESIATIDLDEPNNSEDDPFGIAALVEDEDLISNDDLDLAEQDESEDLSAASAEKKNDADVISEDITDPDLISDLLEQAQTNEVDIDDLLDQVQTDDIDIDDLLAQEQTDEIDVDDLLAQAQTDDIDIDDLLEQEQTDEIDVDDLLEQEQTDDIDVDDLLIQAQTDEIEVDDLIEQEQTDDIDVDDLLAQAQTNEVDIDDLLDQVQTADVDVDDLVAQAQSDDIDVDELVAQAQTDDIDVDNLLEQTKTDDRDVDDLVAQAHTEIDKSAKGESKQSNDFIDIKSLMDKGSSSNNDEPYSEFDLDLGLEEFPDVVNAESHIDIDDDENGTSAQLDLARAYLEIDDKKGAEEILLSIMDNSNSEQRAEIEKLLKRVN